MKSKGIGAPAFLPWCPGPGIRILAGVTASYSKPHKPEQLNCWPGSSATAITERSSVEEDGGTLALSDCSTSDLNSKESRDGYSLDNRLEKEMLTWHCFLLPAVRPRLPRLACPSGKYREM
jgi:hypothetical protein